MEYNTCETCGATEGKCGILIGKKGLPEECLNCSDSRHENSMVIHSNLVRSEGEILKMMKKIFGK